MPLSVGCFGLGQYRPVGGEAFFSVSSHPAPPQQFSDLHDLLSKPSQLLEASTFYREGNRGPNSERICLCAVLSASPERPMAGISPPSSQPVPFVYAPGEQLSLSQPDKELTFTLPSRWSIRSQLAAELLLVITAASL